MRRIDELHLELPFAGARMLRDLLRGEGVAIGRQHVATLMRRMGIEALYRKPNTSRRHRGHPVYPYLLRGAGDHAAEPGLGDGHHLHPDGARLRLSRRGPGLGEPPRPGLARVDHAGQPTSASRPSRRRSRGTARPRSSTPIRAPIHQRGVHRAAAATTASRSAWTGRAAGATTSSSSGSGARSSTRRSICTPTTRSLRPPPASDSYITLYNTRRPHSSLADRTPDDVYFYPAAARGGGLTPRPPIHLPDPVTLYREAEPLLTGELFVNAAPLWCAHAMDHSQMSLAFFRNSRRTIQAAEVRSSLRLSPKPR